jgi:hypothetical protein
VVLRWVEGNISTQPHERGFVNPVDRVSLFDLHSPSLPTAKRKAKEVVNHLRLKL